jgi:soluble lytic murein transglycosylase-like protein
MKLYDELIKAAYARYMPDHDWRMYKAQIFVESSFNPNALSPVGASGLAQFMPATWREWSPKAGFAGVPANDPEASIMTGAAYMAHLYAGWTSPRPEMDRYCLALASYNAGFGNLLRAQRIAEMSNDYSRIVKSLQLVTGQKNSWETRKYVRGTLNYYVSLVVE